LTKAILKKIVKKEIINQTFIIFCYNCNSCGYWSSWI